MKIKKKSDWVFEGSSGGDIGIWVISAQMGKIKLSNKSEPPGKNLLTLNYKAAGVGLDAGLPIGLSFSTESMPDTGVIYVTDNVPGKDLRPSDFDGLVFIHDASWMAAGIGASHTMIFLGISWQSIPRELAKGIAMNAMNQIFDYKGLLLGPLYKIYEVGKFLFSSGDPPRIIEQLAGDAKGIIRMKGMSGGVKVSAGASGLYGYMSSNSTMPWEMYVPGSDPTHNRVSFQVISQDELIIKIPGDVLFGFDKDWIGSGEEGNHAVNTAAASGVAAVGFSVCCL